MLTLGAGHLRKIEAAARAAYPEEACGLLVGLDDPAGAANVTAVVESANVAADDRTRRFEVDPAVRIRLERDLRNVPERLVGHYHSHPGGPAIPSAHDLERVFEPELIWLVIGLREGDIQDVRAWRPGTDGSAFEPVPLTIAA